MKLKKKAEPRRLLFICSKNKWRSPTAERLWYRVPGFEARSAGTARAAVRTVRLEDIQWADDIFVMEDKHAKRLRADFRQDMTHKRLHTLDIPDDYQFMDEELQGLLKEKVGKILGS